MSYAVEPPATAATAPRRPGRVALAAALLAAMGLAGLGYAIATLAVTPGVVDRFRAAAAGADSADVDGFVTVLWIGAAIATVLAVILFALYVVLALGLRRGSNASRIAVWAVCGLGLLAGCGSTVAMLIQRSGEGSPGTIGTALADAYPAGWIGLNVALAVAQIVGYALVATLLLVSPGTFFGRVPAQPQPDPFAARRYGPGLQAPAPGYGQPVYAPPPSYGPRSGYGAPAGHGPAAGYSPVPGYSGHQYGAPVGQGQPPGLDPSAYVPPPGFDPSAYAPPPGYVPPQSPGTPAPGTPDTPAAVSPGPADLAEHAKPAGPARTADPAGTAKPAEPTDPAQTVDRPGYASSPDTAANPPDGPQPGSEDEYWSRPPS
jgi:hypothetical protein